MHIALATLGRRTRTVRILRSVGEAPEGDEAPGEPLRFRDVEDAERYLGFWLDDEAAFFLLRRALGEVGDTAALWRSSHGEVARALAVRLLAGSLLVFEETPRHRPWGERLVPAAEEAIPASALVRSEPAPAPASPPPPVSPALLPLLEEVRIEGAWVLPEVLQTLEQIDLTLGTLELAGLSLEPTPSGVQRIQAEMQKASASATRTLDEL